MSLTYEELIKELGIISKLVYDNKYMSKSDTNIDSSDYFIPFSSNYIVVETSDSTMNTTSGFQGMLLQNLNTMQYVFAFRGTEFSEDPLNDLIITEIGGHVPI